MIKWHKIERINQRLSVIYSKDSQYKIEIFRYTSPTSYRISISKGDSFPIMWYSGVDKWKLLSHAKKRLDVYLKIKNATISKKPKTETKVMARTKKATTKRKKLSGNALKQKAYSLIKSGVSKLVSASGQGKSRNTRYQKKIRKGVYQYKLKNR